MSIAEWRNNMNIYKLYKEKKELETKIEKLESKREIIINNEIIKNRWKLFGYKGYLYNWFISGDDKSICIECTYSQNDFTDEIPIDIFLIEDDIEAKMKYSEYKEKQRKEKLQISKQEEEKEEQKLYLKLKEKYENNP